MMMEVACEPDADVTFILLVRQLRHEWYDCF